MLLQLPVLYILIDLHMLIIVIRLCEIYLIFSFFLSSSFSSALSDGFRSLHSCTHGNHWGLLLGMDQSVRQYLGIRSFLPNVLR